jgi:hypothetical protein
VKELAADIADLLTSDSINGNDPWLADLRGRVTGELERQVLRIAQGGDGWSEGEDDR